jgi:hypothetical protein
LASAPPHDNELVPTPHQDTIVLDNPAAHKGYHRLGDGC